MLEPNGVPLLACLGLAKVTEDIRLRRLHLLHHPVVLLNGRLQFLIVEVYLNLFLRSIIALTVTLGLWRTVHWFNERPIGILVEVIGPGGFRGLLDAVRLISCSNVLRLLPSERIIPEFHLHFRPRIVVSVNIIGAVVPLACTSLIRSYVWQRLA